MKLASNIGELAEFIADDYFPNSPIEPIQIARKKGITVSANHYGDDFDGMIEHRSERFHIYLNLDRVASPNSPRARFTLCHELGHYFIDDHRNALRSGRTPAHPSKCEFESDNPVEIQADHFASNLLLPATRVRAFGRKQGGGIETILALARQFKSSVTAAAVRFASLELQPSVIVKWQDDRFQWMRASPTLWAKGYRKTNEALASFPEQSATQHAMSNAAGENEFHESASVASMWFPFISEFAIESNIILREQAIRLGRFGGITLLTAIDDDFVAVGYGRYV